MNGTLSLIELAGHVGLLLWGTHMVGTGVQRGFGTVLRRWLGRNLGRRFRAFLTGLGVTALLQSSTATGLLATSFTATGVITLAPALAVMLGANVGTALLTQVLFFNVALLGPPLVLVGVLVFRWAGGSRAKNIGRIGIGLGLMLMALAGLVHTLGPLETTPFVHSSSPNPPPGVSSSTFTWRSISHSQRCSWDLSGASHTCSRSGCRTHPRQPIRAGPFISTSRPWIPPRSPLRTLPARLCAWPTWSRPCSAMRSRCFGMMIAHAPRRSPRRIVALISWEPRFAAISPTSATSRPSTDR